MSSPSSQERFLDLDTGRALRHAMSIEPQTTLPSRLTPSDDRTGGGVQSVDRALTIPLVERDPAAGKKAFGRAVPPIWA